MDVKDDKLVVIPATHDPDGHKLEPEQAPAARVVDLGLPLTFNTGASTGLSMPGEVMMETTVGAMAAGLRSACGTCKHWNVARWRQLRREYERGSDMDKRQLVNDIRFNLEQNLDGDERDKHRDAQTGDLDLEAAMDSMGLCEALTEILSKSHQEFTPVLQFAVGGCPDHQGPHGEVLTGHYKPRDRQAERGAATAYDKILGMARGKRPD